MVLLTNSYYLQICIQLFNILSNILFTSSVDLESLLTKTESKKWFLNQTSTSKNPYCSICCIHIGRKQTGRKCKQHTMCVYEEKAQGPACREMITLDFSQEEIDAIVDAHNTLRNEVALGNEAKGEPGPQPPASNMRLMFWDDELANISRRWASQCVFANDACRDVHRFPVGQNIAKGKSGITHDLSYILEWYANVELVNAEDIKAYKLSEDASTSFYSQLVWADTYLVGCARVIFQKADGAEVTYREHFICNYGPSGNIPGQPVYRIGDACSSCLEGTGCTNLDYPGLCGNEIVPMNNIDRRKKKRKMADIRRRMAVEIINGIEDIRGRRLLIVVVSVVIILRNVLVR